jgi:hypothetical protein
MRSGDGWYPESGDANRNRGGHFLAAILVEESGEERRDESLDS